MPSEMFKQLGIHPIINAVGYATRVSGSCPHPEVVAAMTAASSQYFEIDDLLTAASSLIARCTGAEAGIVTCGAGAALTLAAAACLAGNRPEIMDQLPNVSACPRNEIIFPVPGPFDYDHAIRLSGARLVLIDYRAHDALRQIELAITPRTAAIGFVWLRVDERPDLTALADLAHRHGLPIIVDAACALPPMENLANFSKCGADLVAYSGGKHLGGPQASGILCGRADLIRSAWVQMVDMDVREGTWSLQLWIANGWLSRPPRHGIGRSMKVSKESIVGVMAALQRYATRNHAAEYVNWQATIDAIYEGIRDLSELRITRSSHGMNGQPYPNLQIESGAEPCRQNRELQDVAEVVRLPTPPLSNRILTNSATNETNTHTDQHVAEVVRLPTPPLSNRILTNSATNESGTHTNQDVAEVVRLPTPQVATRILTNSATSESGTHTNQDVAEVVRLPTPNALSVRDLLLALRNLPRRIVLAEDEQSPDRAVLYSQCLQPGDAEEIISAIRQVVLSHRERLTR